MADAGKLVNRINGAKTGYLWMLADGRKLWLCGHPLRHVFTETVFRAVSGVYKNLRFSASHVIIP